MNTLKILFWKITVTLIVMFPYGCGGMYAQPGSGDWIATADFGSFVFNVSDDGTYITEITYTFSDWTCGIVTTSGTIAISSGSGWPISDNQFTIENNLDAKFPPKETMTIEGTFDDSGDAASGTWRSVKYGTTCSGSWEVIPNSVEDLRNEDPAKFEIVQNYSSPFNPATFCYQVSKITEVELSIYNQFAQKIRTLVNSRQPAGRYQIQWDGRDKAGNHVANGIYLFRFKAGAFTQTRKVILRR